MGRGKMIKNRPKRLCSAVYQAAGTGSSPTAPVLGAVGGSRSATRYVIKEIKE